MFGPKIFKDSEESDKYGLSKEGVTDNHTWREIPLWNSVVHDCSVCGCTKEYFEKNQNSCKKDSTSASKA